MPQQKQQKAFIEVETGERISCMFNPSALQVSAATSWEADRVPGKGAPDLYFAGGQSGTMSIELTFDGTGDGQPVTKTTDKLMKLMEIDPKLPSHNPDSNTGRPPWVRFHWGDFHSFRAVVESSSLSFTYFSATGVPLRAKASLALRQYEAANNFGPQNPTSGTPRPHRTHQVQPGETLDRIAAAHYGDPTQWQAIAAANAIEDPLALETGSILSIPRLGSLP